MQWDWNGSSHEHRSSSFPGLWLQDSFHRSLYFIHFLFWAACCVECPIIRGLLILSSLNPGWRVHRSKWTLSKALGEVAFTELPSWSYLGSLRSGQAQHGRNKKLAETMIWLEQSLESPKVLAGKIYVRNPCGFCVLEALQRADWWPPVLGVAAGASVDLWIYS